MLSSMRGEGGGRYIESKIRRNSGGKEIGEEAVKHFQKLFEVDGDPHPQHMQHIKKLVTHEDNQRLTQILDEEEMKAIIFWYGN